MNQHSGPRRSVAVGLLLVTMLLPVGCSSPGSGSSQSTGDSESSALVEEQPFGDPVLRVVAPLDGSVVTSPVGITVALENFSLAAKGLSRDREGHFHVVIDAPCLEPGAVIDDNHVHVGSGDASTEIDLPPGDHQLCLQIGDGFHTALAITETIEVTVVQSTEVVVDP